LRHRVDAMAGFLQHVCGVKRGDRVLIALQNSPQCVVAYYAVMRADAVIVPVNPMNKTEEIAYLVADSGRRWRLSAASCAKYSRRCCERCSRMPWSLTIATRCRRIRPMPCPPA
jgi:acyl-CoA synthetase (AMP-forming)/AMP-acid ligase II